MNLNADPREEKTDETVSMPKSQGHIEEAPIILEEPSIQVEVVVTMHITENDDT